MIGAQDGEVDDAAGYLVTMMQGMGDDVEWSGSDDGVVLEQLSLRVIRGLGEAEAGLVFDCWAQLWQGTASSQRQLKRLEVQRLGDAARWSVVAAFVTVLTKQLLFAGQLRHKCSGKVLDPA